MSCAVCVICLVHIFHDVFCAVYIYFIMCVFYMYVYNKVCLVQIVLSVLPCSMAPPIVCSAALPSQPGSVWEPCAAWLSSTVLGELVSSMRYLLLGLEWLFSYNLYKLRMIIAIYARLRMIVLLRFISKLRKILVFWFNRRLDIIINIVMPFILWAGNYAVGTLFPELLLLPSCAGFFLLSVACL